MSQDPEVQTFNHLFATIKTAIKMGIVSLASEAFSAALITSSEMTECTHEGFSANRKVQNFLEFIQQRVAMNPDALEQFRNILNKEPAYASIVKKIGMFGGEGLSVGLWVRLTIPCSLL